MKLGIKVNADKDSFDRLARSNPSLAEVWFNANTPDTYKALFTELKQRSCDVGLHFWGQINNGILANIAYPDPDQMMASMDLIHKTIDIAAKHSFRYVNIHPGAAAAVRVNFQKERFDAVSKPVDTDQAIGTFLSNALELHAYAQSRNIEFTVETVPIRITDGWYDAETRLRPKNVYELPVEAIVRAAKAGIPVANDFSHTAANIVSDDPQAVWTFLKNITTQLASQTRLIHAGFIIPPYNGTDNHDEFDNPIFETPMAVPNSEQITELLKIFHNRTDVWILAEPKQNHVKNYQILQRIVNQSA